MLSTKDVLQIVSLRRKIHLLRNNKKKLESKEIQFILTFLNYNTEDTKIFTDSNGHVLIAREKQNM